MSIARRVRGVVLVAAASVALVAAGLHALPRPAPAAAAPKAAAAPSRAPAPGRPLRPYGVLHLDGLDIPSPQMREPEVDAVHLLVADGIVVRKIDATAWDALFERADADEVMTDDGSVTLIAPGEPGHPTWVCPAEVEGAMIGGGDAPSYELGVGGDRVTVQIAGPVIFGRLGDSLVVTADPGLWQRMRPVVQAAGCPGTQ